MKVNKEIKNDSKQETIIPSNILFVLYLLVGYSYFIEFESESFQWLYFSLLNVISLGYIVLKKKGVFTLNFIPKTFFLTATGLTLISFISIIKSIYISESLVHISRLVNSFVAIFCIICLIREKPKYYFELLCKVFLIILIYDSFIALKYSLSNFEHPRTDDLIKNFNHHQGNINIYTASLIIKFPFVFYLFINQNKLWKYLSYLSVFMVIFALLFSGSRTALISLFIISLIILLYNTLQFLKDKKVTLFIPSLILLSSFIISVFLFKNINRVDKRQMNSFSLVTSSANKDYKKIDVLKRKHPNLSKTNLTLKNNFKNKLSQNLKEKLGARYDIWESAYNLFEDNFFMGVGYGQFKLSSRPYYYKNKYNSDGKRITKRVHNDYLEKFTETGVLGGFLFLALFIIIFYGQYKLLYSQKSASKEIILLLSLSLISYLIDSFFNFPIERANINLIFIVICAFTLVLLTNENENAIIKGFNKTILLYPVILISLFSLISNYLVFKSYKLNQYVAGEVRENNIKNSKYSFNYLQDKTFSYPELTFNAIHKDYFSIFFHKETKSLEKKLQIINAIPKKTFLDSLLFFEAKAKLFYDDFDKYADSIKYLSMENVKKRPSLGSSILLIEDVLTKEKDTTKLLELYNFITKHNTKNSKVWLKKTNLIHKKTKNKGLAIKTLDTALYYNENNYDILNNKIKFSLSKNNNNKKDYDLIAKYFKEQNYTAAKKVLERVILKKPKDYVSVRNLGIVEMNLKNYKKAVEFLTIVINEANFKDGKAEFCRGFSYEKLKQFNLAKKDYNISRAKGFPQAMALKEHQYK